MAPISASNAFARMICRARPVSFDSPRERRRKSFIPRILAASEILTVLTRAARYAVRSPSGFSGYFAYKNSVTTSSKTASPKNSNRSLCSAPLPERVEVRFSLRYERRVKDCSSKPLSVNTYPIFDSKTAKSAIHALLSYFLSKKIDRPRHYRQNVVVKIKISYCGERKPLCII